MNRKPNLAVVGATGVVGTTFLKVLDERDFPFENLYIMASAKSAGKTITFKGKDYVVEELNEHSFDKPIDIALFSAGGSVSEKFAPIAAEHGVVVVDVPVEIGVGHVLQGVLIVFLLQQIGFGRNFEHGVPSFGKNTKT